MFSKIGLKKSGNILLLLLLGCIISLTGCSTVQEKKTKEAEVKKRKTAEVNWINVIPDVSGKGSIIQIARSKDASYTAFKLVQPSRIIVDVNAERSKELSAPALFSKNLIEDIELKEIQGEPAKTRIVASLKQDSEYNVDEKGNIIRVSIFPKESAEAPKTPPAPVSVGREVEPKEPRIFFEPGKGRLNKILGIDFCMLPKGRSRVTVTTSEKADYDLKRKSRDVLALDLKYAYIPEELNRYIDTTHFKGAVNRIVPEPINGLVRLNITLNEMVPYHLIQTEKELNLDFNKPVYAETPSKVIKPARLNKSLFEPETKVAQAEEEGPAGLSVETYPITADKNDKEYKGERMTLEFSNADIKNVLKLISEVSKMNIVWGPEISGTVSMKLKNVPWDQALNVILETNDLGMIKKGNIIWITTKSKIKELEREKEEKIKAEQERMRQLRAAEKKAESEKPLVTEYLHLDFARAEEIKDHILLTDRGTVSMDERTNTVIIKDTQEQIREARKIVEKFDIPVKQIMIEARIVDASTNFTKDLGLQWNSFQRQWQKRSGMNWGTDPTQYNTFGDMITKGAMSTNAPDNWAGNIGLTFARLTNRGLGTLALDATLALAETDNKAKVISAPKVIASNGKEATISRGDSIIIPATENVESTTLDATLSLTVTPTVSFNNYITLEVQVTDDQAPSTQRLLRKSIDTTLMVKSGETVVIGGIYKETKGEDETGIPWLKEIPVLGWLFKARRNSLEKTELLIFLTPRVLPPPGKEL